MEDISKPWSQIQQQGIRSSAPAALPAPGHEHPCPLQEQAQSFVLPVPQATHHTLYPLRVYLRCYLWHSGFQRHLMSLQNCYAVSQKIGAKHNQKWKEFGPELQTHNFIKSLPGTRGFIRISRNLSFALCQSRPSYYKIIFLQAVPQPGTGQGRGCWVFSTSEMLSVSCGVSQEADEGWELIS